MKALIGAAVVALATVTVVAQETKLGAGVTLKDATPIASLVNKPDRVRRQDGARRRCRHGSLRHDGLLDGDRRERREADAKTVRVKVEDGVIKIPVTAKGKKVSAEGVFEVAGDEHAKEAAAEHAKQMAASPVRR